ncbi:MAG: GNAT family N-acetyltransferase [Proteobacteria bacterium]|nr:GNAT family N-acetyltransferase [Pseudomonadota bacterium]
MNNGWTLTAATDADIDEIMTWFPDAAAVDLWGGPGFRYPYTRETFREDCCLDKVDSYGLRDASGRLAAFGQSYERYGRGHLARLVSNPSMRRKGAGKQLIRMITALLADRYDEYSLFVFRHNLPAYRCYLSLGFAVAEYPADAALPDKCYFLTKRAAGARDDG